MSSTEPTNESRSTPSVFPRGRSPSGFFHGVTLALSFVLVGFLLSLATPGTQVAPLLRLKRPAETAMRVFERQLEIEDALRDFSGLERALVAITVDAAPAARDDAITAFEGLIDHPRIGSGSIGGWELPITPEEFDALRARRAVLLLEAGRADDARSDLEQLDLAGHASFVAAARVAYARTQPTDARAFEAYDVRVAGDGWIGRRLQWRLATETRDGERVARIERETREMRETVAARIRKLAWAGLAPLLAGLLIVLLWLARNRPENVRAGAPIPPVWTLENGYAVFVRAVFYAFATALALDGIGRAFELGFVTLWSTFFCAIPVWMLARKRLLAFNGLRLGPTFGLTGLSKPLAWVAFTLGVLALDRLGSQTIVTLCRALGAASHWAEVVSEDQIWSPRLLAWLDGIDTCVWAPFFEEFVCRGLLYLTLRRIYPPFGAALLSGAIFGAVHLYSLPGFAAVTWSGVVWALAFERCRSLWPGIVCHAINNVFAIASTWVLLR